ncbi:hypothetical protein T230_13345 [Tannerella sp. oral taxon BU063 isolate Cell 1/3]|uniref:Uncharacterized protein n=1 Tax=Tannerella sp. oral taxon BU063 isolate Cell 1/3 TaxID=1411022 RepID=W2CIN6_9BACT|nr:hypothetical protein T230_13345 [Tannerella sp. oral taxon BU063 isolate Cell 1/3]
MNGIRGTANDASFTANGALKGQDTQVDAAVQLLNNARVCVTGNVDDATGNIGDAASGDGGNLKTNALIVVPHSSRFTLRTFGNFKANMAHLRADSAENKNVLYTAAAFQDPATDIMLKSTSNVW